MGSVLLTFLDLLFHKVLKLNNYSSVVVSFWHESLLTVLSKFCDPSG